MAHAHAHHIHHRTATKKLAISTGLTIVFVVVGIVAGIYANSLALIGDAFHNFTDALALGLAFWALRLERRPPTPSKSFGYQRAGVLAAFLNAGTLVGLTAYLLIEAWERFREPEPVNSTAMLVAAFAGLAVNTFITLWLREEGKRDLTVRSAMLHMLGDALSSVGIIIGAILIRWSGNVLIDPAITVLISALIAWSSWGILRETVNLLLEGTPREIDPEAVSRDLAAQDGVYGVHHLHIWAITPTRPALSCHLMLGDVSLKSAGEIMARVQAMLSEKYRISHTTIQIEYAGCAVDDPFCVVDENELVSSLFRR